MIRLDDIKASKIAVVGLGYVGLPLAVALSKHFPVIGYDISERRVSELQTGQDATGEVNNEDLALAPITYTSQPEVLRGCRLVIVAVPTPIAESLIPDLGPITGATSSVGANISPGTVVVYESTVYPGLTEEICIPILEKRSGLVCGRDFWVGYSPERINPGDKVHTLETIVKVVAGQTPCITELLAQVYGTIVKAGIHKASSIKVAEAAKIIENTQRDINIALMNELAHIFGRMGIDTQEVLEAAGTKWNFLPFRPGLVGGHCIGVDPYYLTFKAQSMGYNPQVILAGRRINDSMGKAVAEQVIKAVVQADLGLPGARIGVLGFTFKENVPDLRNTKVVDVVRELEAYRAKVLVHDAMADYEEARHEYGLELVPFESLRDLDAVILAVPHARYLAMDAKVVASLFKPGATGFVFDIKAAWDVTALRHAGLKTWRL